MLRKKSEGSQVENFVAMVVNKLHYLHCNCHSGWIYQDFLTLWMTSFVHLYWIYLSAVERSEHTVSTFMQV